MKNITLKGIASLIIVFVIDYSTPVEIAAGFLYIIPILLAAKLDERKIIVLTCVAIVAILFNYMFFSLESPSFHWWVTVNQFVAIISLCITSLIILVNKVNQRRIFKEALMKERLSSTDKIEEIIFIISHKIRKPIANIIMITQMIDEDYFSEQEEKDEVISFVGRSVQELDVVTREITESITRSKILFL